MAAPSAPAAPTAETPSIAAYRAAHHTILAIIVGQPYTGGVAAHGITTPLQPMRSRAMFQSVT